MVHTLPSRTVRNVSSDYAIFDARYVSEVDGLVLRFRPFAWIIQTYIRLQISRPIRHKHSSLHLAAAAKRQSRQSENVPILKTLLFFPKTNYRTPQSFSVHTQRMLLQNLLLAPIFLLAATTSAGGAASSHESLMISRTDTAAVPKPPFKYLFTATLELGKPLAPIAIPGGSRLGTFPHASPTTTRNICSRFIVSSLSLEIRLFFPQIFSSL